MKTYLLTFLTSLMLTPAAFATTVNCETDLNSGGLGNVVKATIVVEQDGTKQLTLFVKATGQTIVGNLVQEDDTFGKALLWLDDAVVKTSGFEAAVSLHGGLSYVATRHYMKGEDYDVLKCDGNGNDPEDN